MLFHSHICPEDILRKSLDDDLRTRPAKTSPGSVRQTLSPPDWRRCAESAWRALPDWLLAAQHASAPHALTRAIM